MIAGGLALYNWRSKVDKRRRREERERHEQWLREHPEFRYQPSHSKVVRKAVSRYRRRPLRGLG